MTTFRTIAPSLVALFASIAPIALPSVAHAGPTCAQDADCGHGFACQVTGGTACPAIACAPNENCPPIDCTPSVTRECVPGSCESDGDCATGMVCYAQSETACASPPSSASCDPMGAACPPPAPFDAGACTTTTTKSCVPRYLVPCSQNSDCGAGFTCMPDEVCSCSAGSAVVGGQMTGGPSVPPGRTPPSGLPEDSGTPAPSCTCNTSGTSHCAVNAVTCTTDSDCPTMWTCVQPPSPVVNCGTGGLGAPSSDDAGPVPQLPCQGLTPTASPSMCQPPYYEMLGSFGSGSASAATGDAPRAAGSATATDDASGPNKSSGGCTVARGSTDSGAALGLGLLGLFAVGRRRRARY